MQPFDRIVEASPGITPAAAQQELQRAFSAWQTVADLMFVETTDPERANIIIGADAQQIGAAANLSFRDPDPPLETANVRDSHEIGAAHDRSPILTRHQTVPIHQAYVCLDANWRWKVGFDGNLAAYDLRHTFIHEIGHTIGLDHPGRTGALMGFRYDEHATELQPSDINAVQALYGRPQKGK
jgi:hypothetical protein